MTNFEIETKLHECYKIIADPNIDPTDWLKYSMAKIHYEGLLEANKLHDTLQVATLRMKAALVAYESQIAINDVTAEEYMLTLAENKATGEAYLAEQEAYLCDMYDTEINNPTN